MDRNDRLALAHRAEMLPLPESGRVVVLRAAPSGFLDAVPAERLICEQSLRPVHDGLVRQGRPVTERVEGPAGLVVLNLTRSRAENLGNVARGLKMLPPGGLLAVNGARTDGIDSLARQVAGVLPLDETFVKAHGRVVRFRRPEALPEVLPEAVAAWEAAAEPSRNGAGFLTAPGLFSPDGPDPGSMRMAAHLDAEMSGRVADLGAGWGWLAQAALARAGGIERIELFEAEARALDAARVNAADPRTHFHWADVTALGVKAGPFDWVIANPPFHTGRAAEPDLGRAFIAAAARILAPNGRLLMVANRQLPYEAALGDAFREHRILSEDARFKVLAARRPSRR